MNCGRVIEMQQERLRAELCRKPRHDHGMLFLCVKDKGTRMRILVVDDHPLIQVALRHVLEELDAALELFQAHDARAARDVLSVSPQLDLIILDLTLPGCDGFDFLRELRRDWPGIPVLVLSATHDRATIESALDMGAMGFIPKTANSQLLLGAMRLVLAGGVYVPTESNSFDGMRLRPVAKPSELGLTVRQADVLKLLVQGKPNKLICRDLRLSEGTVKVHVSAILRALNVHTRTQVVIELARRGVRLEPPAARAR
jgi:DNA-binding NarL/FixJ family response regulator